MMHLFFYFMIWTLALIWNGKICSTKQWFLAGVMFVLVLVATVVIGFMLKWLAQSMSLFRRNGETIFDYLFHVFPVRMGTKSYRCAARHDLSGIIGAQKMQC